MSIIRFDTIPPEIMQAMCTPMHLIMPSSGSVGALYLGSMTAVNDADLLQEHRISHLVQVLDIAWLPAARAGFECYRIDIRDSTSADLRPHLESACSYIDKALRSGQNVLVHCQQVRIHRLLPIAPLLLTHHLQGISRSAAIVIAYLIRNHNMSLDTAYALVKRKRACMKPNSGFVQCLQEWESQWRRPAAPRRFTT
jgi:protein-tyrosine phosphatase